MTALAGLKGALAVKVLLVRNHAYLNNNKHHIRLPLRCKNIAVITTLINRSKRYYTWKLGSKLV